VITYASDPVVSPDSLVGFFDGWPTAPTPDVHAELLRRSALAEVAFDGDRVIGFATAISDGVLSAYIPLLEVHSTHRGRGIGTILIERLLARLSDLYMVDVVCDDDVAPFYARLGFTRAAGMMRRNYGAQGGSL
jgi:GNAT superfamily N-acetyltransferase